MPMKCGRLGRFYLYPGLSQWLSMAPFSVLLSCPSPLFRWFSLCGTNVSSSFDHSQGVPERAPANVTDAKTPNIRKCKRKAEDIVEAQAKRVVSDCLQSR